MSALEIIFMLFYAMIFSYSVSIKLLFHIIRAVTSFEFGDVYLPERVDLRVGGNSN